jgi:hypothetical protein
VPAAARGAVAAALENARAGTQPPAETQEGGTRAGAGAAGAGGGGAPQDASGDRWFALLWEMTEHEQAKHAKAQMRPGAGADTGVYRVELFVADSRGERDRWIGLLATRCAGSSLLLADGRKAELRRRKEGAGPAGGGE